MKSANEIFERSMNLIGELMPDESELMSKRAVELINVVLSELYELELSFRGERIEDAPEVPQVESLDDTVSFSDPILYSLIPIGLAAYLLNEEEPERSSFFMQLYHTQRELLRSKLKRSRRHKIRRSF